MLRENDCSSWNYFANWAMQKRAQAKSIIFIHHAGKDGEQRGTSKREDILDTVISLKKQKDAETSHGTKFEIHFEKARHLSEAPSMLAHLNSKTNQWNVTNISQSRKIKILEMHELGMKASEIAKD